MKKKMNNEKKWSVWAESEKHFSTPLYGEGLTFEWNLLSLYTIWTRAPRLDVHILILGLCNPLSVYSSVEIEISGWMVEICIGY